MVGKSKSGFGFKSGFNQFWIWVFLEGWIWIWRLDRIWIWTLLDLPAFGQKKFCLFPYQTTKLEVVHLPALKIQVIPSWFQTDFRLIYHIPFTMTGTKISESHQCPWLFPSPPWSELIITRVSSAFPEASIASRIRPTLDNFYISLGELWNCVPAGLSFL